jgi:uncharacterized coiled-coil protein SlyX
MRGRFTSRLALAVVALLALHAGCARFRKSPAAVPPPAAAPAPSSRETELEARVARLELRLLERDGQIEELQSRLDEARREVVRAMAKLQTLATRAEAASGIAEAELALQGLRRRVAQEAAPEVGQVAQLIEMSTAEFDRQNYGGALYLANQAKSIAATRRGRLAADREELRLGETLFAVPLRLQVRAQSNVRDGPGMGFRVVFTLEQATPVTGHSHAGEWVRISDESGRSGWVFLTLVGRRD